MSDETADGMEFELCLADVVVSDDMYNVDELKLNEGSILTIVTENTSTFEVTCTMSGLPCFEPLGTVGTHIECDTEPTEDLTFDITSAHQYPQNGDVISDCFNRFEASIQLFINQKLTVNPLCLECFKWYIQDTNATDHDSLDSELITFYNVKIGEYTNENMEPYDIIQSYIVINSIRTTHAGYCVDSNLIDKHPLTPGNNYRIHLQVETEDGTPIYSSSPVTISTNEAPHGGYCQIYDFENTFVLVPFRLECYDWIASKDHNRNVSYNALFGDVLMMDSFQLSPRSVKGLVGVGGFEIVALIQDDSQSTACYEMNVTFPSIVEIFNTTNITVDILNERIDAIAGSVNTSADNGAIIAAYSVIDGLYKTSMTDMQRSSDVVQALVENVIYLSVDEIISDLSTLAQITSNNEIVNHEVVNILVDYYIPLVIYDIMNSFIDTYADEDIAGQLYSIVTQTQTLIVQLEHVLINTTINASRMNHIAERLTEYSLYSAHIALAESLPSESYKYISVNAMYEKIILAKKFDSNQRNVNESVQCGYIGENIVIPNAFKMENEGKYDCTFSRSTIDIYRQELESGFVHASNVVAVNIYEDYGGSIEATQYQTTQCDPYLITINATDKSILDNDGEIVYSFDIDDRTGKAIWPKCNFWNITTDLWDGFECFVYNFSLDKGTVTCGCLHLSTFKLSKTDVEIKTNIIGEWHLRNFTISNLIRFPTVWITQLILFVITVIICLINKAEHGNRSILAYEDIIFEKVKEEKIKDDVIGKEIEYIAKYLPNRQFLGEGISKLSQGRQAKKSLCHMQFQLFVLYLCNDHTVLSVFQRTHGTNLSSKTRIACFFMYLCTVMFATAVFYGQRQNSSFGDVTASFLISLIGTAPVFITKKIMFNSKPVIIPLSVVNIVSEDMQDVDQDAIQKPNMILPSLLKTTTKYDTSLDLIKTQKMNVRQVTLRNALGEVKKTKSTAAQVKLADVVRTTLFNTVYPLSHKYKAYAWIFLVVWTLFVIIMALFYGIQFDLKYTEKRNNDNPNVTLFDQECWWNNKLLVIEDLLSANSFKELQQSLRSNFNDDYANNEESSKWILSLFQSLCLSVFLWQPLMVYIITWIKIWMFSWNLTMKLSPVNLWTLCKRALSKVDKSNLRKELSFACNIDAKKNKAYHVIAHENRPLDVIGYFSNDDLFLKINEETGKLAEIGKDLSLTKDDEKEMEMVTTIGKKEKKHAAGKKYTVLPVMDTGIDLDESSSSGSVR
eukprot:77310_1